MIPNIRNILEYKEITKSMVDDSMFSALSLKRTKSKHSTSMISEKMLNRYSRLIKIDDLDDVVLTLISNYFVRSETVFSFMLISSKIHSFLYDSSLIMSVGRCCIHVIYKLSDELSESASELVNYNKTYCDRLKLCVLKKCEHFVNLARVDNIFDEELQYLAQISTLYTRNNQFLTDKGFVYLKRIRKLDISFCNNIKDEGIIKYLSNNNFEILIAQKCKGITDEGLKGFINSRLKVLNVKGNDNISDKGISYLPNSLYDLDISDCPKITDKGLKSIGKFVMILKIQGNKNITDKGISYLERIYKLNLSSVNYASKITDKGISHLGNNNIRILKIKYNLNITDKCLTYLKGINTLNLYECPNITNEGIKKLKDINGELTISYSSKINHEGLKFIKKAKVAIRVY